MKRRLLGFALFILLFAPLSVVHADKSYSADYFNVDVTVEQNGSLLVTETVAFTFVGDPFTFVFREIPIDLTDGITVLDAAVDGRSYPAGTNAGEVEVERGNPVRVTWHMEPTADNTRVFTLRYRLLGVVQQSDNSDLLLYQPLPDEYEYTIGSSTTTITYPAGVSLVDTPKVQAGTAELTQSGNTMTFRSQNLGPDDTLVVSVPFAPGSVIAAPPAWQADQMARRAQTEATMLPWLALSGLILVAGMGGLSAYYRRHRADVRESGVVMYDPPTKLPPALAGALQTTAVEADWSAALAALFDLAERGALEIEEIPKEKWYQSQEFVVRQMKRPSSLRPHEAALLNLIFEDKKGNPTTEVKMSELSARVTGKRWKTFKETVREELAQLGYLSDQRQQARQRLLVASLAIFFLAIASLVAVVFWLDQLGAWVFAAVGAMVLIGLMGIILSSAIVPLNDEGARVASQWRDFKAYLQNVSKGKAAMTRPDMFERYLPLAAGFGLLYTWAKHLEKEGWQQVPHYFHAHSDNNMGAFVAVIASSSSSGGAAGGAGAAGAGAAGGGASGAG